MYQNVLKPLFFWMTPERAHYAAMDLFVLHHAFLVCRGGFVGKSVNKMKVKRLRWLD